MRWWAAIGAAAVALAVAAVASAGQPNAHQPSFYLYSKTRGLYLSTAVSGGQAWSVYQPQVVERWVADDGSGRQRTASRTPWFATPRDRQAWEEVGKPRFLAHGFRAHVGDETLPRGSFKQQLHLASLVSQMPDDPARLSIWLRDRVNDPASGEGAGNGFEASVKTLELAGGLMQSPATSQAQRAALFEAELLVPGVERLGTVSDSVGRYGTAIGARSSNSGAPTLYSLVFDTDASRILETKDEWLAPPAGLPHMPEKAMVSSTAYLVDGATPTIRARPGKRGGAKHAARR
jgi:hypothetical protein